MNIENKLAQLALDENQKVKDALLIEKQKEQIKKWELAGKIFGENSACFEDVTGEINKLKLKNIDDFEIVYCGAMDNFTYYGGIFYDVFIKIKDLKSLGEALDMHFKQHKAAEEEEQNKLINQPIQNTNWNWNNFWPDSKW